MAKKFSVRLWSISKRHAQGPSLREALEAIWQRPAPGARMRQLAPGIRCRLERYDAQNGILAGEMTRVRHEDYPSEVHHDRVAPLNVDVPIGDSIAFRFRERDHRLAFQYDDRILAAGRFLDYLEALHQNAFFDLRPIADRDALARFQRQPLKKVRIKIANPIDVAAEEDSMQAAATSFRQLGRAYNAPVVTLEMSVGHGGGSLGEAAKRMVMGFLRNEDDSDLRQLRATPASERGGSSPEINMIDSLFVHKEDIESPRDLDENYLTRQRVLERILNAQH